MRNFIDTRTQRHNDVPANILTQRCKDKIDAILNNPDGYKVNDEYNHDDVRGKLIHYFGVKCVYCESSPIASSTFRIDHFRPKKHIKELPEADHRGYYWLAYEWTNFVQSCQLCNQGKSNHFPLVDETSRLDEHHNGIRRKQYRKITTSPLRTEQRLLLHPELDETEKYFVFHEDGTIDSPKREGKMSIKVYDLNRKDLIFWRQKIYQEYFTKIKKKLDEYDTDMANANANAEDFLYRALRDYFREWLGHYSNKKESAYSMFYFFMFHSFSDFFTRHIINPTHAKLLSDAHTKFQSP